MKCKKEGCLGTLVRRYVGLSASRPYDPYSVPVCDICGQKHYFIKDEIKKVGYEEFKNREQLVFNI